MVSRQEIEESADVEYLVVDELIRLVNAHPADEHVSFVRTLSSGHRAIWGVFMVDSEVNNGGP